MIDKTKVEKSEAKATELEKKVCMRGSVLECLLIVRESLGSVSSVIHTYVYM